MRPHDSHPGSRCANQSALVSSLITVYGSLLTEIFSSAIEPVLVIFWPAFRWAMLLHHVARRHHARHKVVLLDDSLHRKWFRPREEAAGVTVVTESRPLGPGPHVPVENEGMMREPNC